MKRKNSKKSGKAATSVDSEVPQVEPKAKRQYIRRKPLKSTPKITVDTVFNGLISNLQTITGKTYTPAQIAKTASLYSKMMTP